MIINNPKPMTIQLDETQLRVSGSKYLISQHPSGLNLAHLGFSALLLGKVSILSFATELGHSLSFEFVDKKFRVFPNGRRQFACDISRWELEAIDGLIVECLLGMHQEEVSIDMELRNISGDVSFVFLISEYFL